MYFNFDKKVPNISNGKNNHYRKATSAITETFYSIRRSQRDNEATGSFHNNSTDLHSNWEKNTSKLNRLWEQQHIKHPLVLIVAAIFLKRQVIFIKLYSIIMGIFFCQFTQWKTRSSLRLKLLMFYSILVVP